MHQAHSQTLTDRIFVSGLPEHGCNTVMLELHNTSRRLFPFSKGPELGILQNAWIAILGSRQAIHGRLLTVLPLVFAKQYVIHSTNFPLDDAKLNPPSPHQETLFGVCHTYMCLRKM